MKESIRKNSMLHSPLESFDPQVYSHRGVIWTARNLLTNFQEQATFVKGTVVLKIETGLLYFNYLRTCYLCVKITYHRHLQQLIPQWWIH
jgi:hypothetical protein